MLHRQQQQQSSAAGRATRSHVDHLFADSADSDAEDESMAAARRPGLRSGSVSHPSQQHSQQHSPARRGGRRDDHDEEEDAAEGRSSSEEEDEEDSHERMKHEDEEQARAISASDTVDPRTVRMRLSGPVTAALPASAAAYRPLAADASQARQARPLLSDDDMES